MKFLLPFLLLIIALPANAQSPKISEKDQCFHVWNQSGYRVYGSIETDFYEDQDGFKRHHRANFVLEHQEKQQFCTKGPFYPGGKVALVLRTIVPVFNCKTKPYGDVIIRSREKDDGGTELYASCVL
ncbi:MAG: hypothetical protein GC136_07950 [Alphaproteobacteria bacterium]|nr:hypothetical protein [Alphaproteobacteria bacterium]